MGAVQAAPAAVNSYMPSRKFDVSSLRDGQMGDKLVRACLPMLTVCAHTSEGYGLVDTAGTYHGTVKLSPVIPNLLCPLLLNEARNYTRYRFRRLRFTYYAIGSTASGVRLNFAFVNDALQAEFSAISSSSSYNLLSSTPNSIPFSPWSPWSMSCNIGSDLCYTGVYSSTVAANTRQAYAGMIACLADSDPGATFTYGQLWWDFDVELRDVCPTTSGLPTSAAFSSGVAQSQPSGETGESAGLMTGANVNPNLGPLSVLSVTALQLSNGLARADRDYVAVEDVKTTSSSGNRVTLNSTTPNRK